MKGIEILNKTQVMTTPDDIGSIVATRIVIFLILLVIVGICATKDSAWPFTISLVLACAAFVWILLAGEIEVPAEGRYRYEVIISDDVSITDVYENYNVIEKDGKKWILEDKED